ncbi:MAG: hypothetical protein KDD99_29140, partial [Bacteroidetes bacterium]|nr:hypothetical protein [Bacteroidota bacterium]
GDAKIAFIHPFATYAIRRYKAKYLFTQPLPQSQFPSETCSMAASPLLEGGDQRKGVQWRIPERSNVK